MAAAHLKLASLIVRRRAELQRQGQLARLAGGVGRVAAIILVPLEVTALRAAIERILEVSQARQIETEEAGVQRQHGLFQAAMEEFGLGIALDPSDQGLADTVVTCAANGQFSLFQRQAVAIAGNGVELGLAEQALPRHQGPRHGWSLSRCCPHSRSPSSGFLRVVLASA